MLGPAASSGASVPLGPAPASALDDDGIPALDDEGIPALGGGSIALSGAFGWLAVCMGYV